MTKEQEKAIECIKDMINYIRFNEKKKYTEQEWFYAQEEILNLIQTQANDIQRMQELLDLSDANNAKKEKTIELMAKWIFDKDYTENSLFIHRDDYYSNCIKQVEQYFERKIENETSNDKLYVK